MSRDLSEVVVRPDRTAVARTAAVHTVVVDRTVVVRIVPAVRMIDRTADSAVRTVAARTAVRTIAVDCIGRHLRIALALRTDLLHHLHLQILTSHGFGELTRFHFWHDSGNQASRGCCRNSKRRSAIT